METEIKIGESKYRIKDMTKKEADAFENKWKLNMLYLGISSNEQEMRKLWDKLEKGMIREDQFKRLLEMREYIIEKFMTKNFPQTTESISWETRAFAEKLSICVLESRLSPEQWLEEPNFDRLALAVNNFIYRGMSDTPEDKLAVLLEFLNTCGREQISVKELINMIESLNKEDGLKKNCNVA